jgi:hypothetical protein
MIAMPHHRFVITAALGREIPRDVFTFPHHLQQELNGNGAQEFRTIVVSSVRVTLLDPRDSCSGTRDPITKDHCTGTDIKGNIIIV